MTSYQKSLLTTALDLVRGGYFVFPLTVVLNEETGKKRLSMPFDHAEGWNVHSSNDETQVREWFATPRKSMKGLAIDCGKSGIVAIDLDVSDTVNGIEEWKKLPAQQETPMTVVTRSGGVHRFYRESTGRVRNSAGEVAPGIDVRGAGGLVITAPTQVFGSGGAMYSFGGPIVAVDDLPELTANMVEVITSRQEAPRPKFDPSIHGSYKVSKAQGEEILKHRLERLQSGRGMRAAIFGYAVGYAQFEAAKAEKDNADLDEDTVRDAIARDILEIVPWEALDDEDLTWIADGVAKGMSQPWEIAEDEEVLPEVDTDVPLSELLQREAPRMPGHPRTSHALAAPVVVSELEGRYLHVHGLGWHEWTGDRWSPEPNIPVRSAVQRAIQRHRAESNRMLKAFDENEERRGMVEELEVLESSGSGESQRARELKATIDEANEWRLSWKSYGSWWFDLGKGQDFDQVMKFVENDPGRIYIRPDQLDGDPNLLNCPNGTVDLRTGVLRPHNPRDYITKTTKVPFDPAAAHEMWDKARKAFAPGTEDWLQMKVGEGAFGRPSNDDTMLFSFGQGSNGKSTLTDAILYSLGDYAIFLHDKAVLGADGDHSTEKMVFRGARWAILEELPEAQVLRPAVIKKLIGTSKITARMMRKDNVTFDATHSLLINSNHRPQVLENDRGTWRRLIAVPWPYTYKFQGENLDDEFELRADPRVKHSLKSDIEVQKAALAWIVAGAVQFTEGGSCGELPELVDSETRSWRLESDTFGTFFENELVLDKKSVISAKELLESYNEYMTDMGKKPVSDTYISTRLSTIKGARGVSKKFVRKTARDVQVSTRDVLSEIPGRFQGWVGLRWRTEAEKVAE